MTIKAPKKLIEVALPLDAINVASAREKSIRHGHPSTLHLWWARRPLAAARAVLFAQLVNDPGGERGWGKYKGQTKEDAKDTEPSSAGAATQRGNSATAPRRLGLHRHPSETSPLPPQRSPLGTVTCAPCSIPAEFVAGGATRAANLATMARRIVTKRYRSSD